jgi:hypothetical protein
MKNPQITSAIATLCEVFNRTPTPATFAAYEIGLSGISPQAVERAVANGLQRWKFMPSPAEIREIAITGGGSFESAADRAFTVLQDAVRRHGSDCSVNFEDGAINAAVRRLGGWWQCCDQPKQQFEVWYRKGFIATYTAILREGATEEERRHHVGRMEVANQKWEGLPMPGGGVYQLGAFGTGVISIGSKYQPLLPSPEPQPRRRISVLAEASGLQLKVVGRKAS